MLLLAWILGCNDTIINEMKRPEIIVAPSTLDFGHLLSGHESDTMTITITNAGFGELVVDHLTIVGDNYSADTSEFSIAPGGWHQIEVSYTPQTFEHNEGYVDIYLEGLEDPAEGVWLTGNGDAPVINVTPSQADFGNPLLGCDSSLDITIQNDGNVDLVVDDIDIMSNIPAEIEIDFGTLPDFPWTIAPAGRIDFFAKYSPEDEDADTTTLDVISNDPLTPVFPASAIGDAVLSNEQIETWIQQSQVVVDIVWIIDNSGSMGNFQRLLGLNMDIFMNMFMNYSPDFRMVFITTDDPNFVGGQIIHNGSADPIGAAVTIIDSIGLGGSAVEKGLGMFSNCLFGGDCSSLIRTNAKLIAIFMSDEPDSSRINIQDLIANIDGVKPGDFIPYGIIGDIPNGCRNADLNATPGTGYDELINHYGSQWWSICDNDWGNQLEELAQNISLKTKFELAAEDPHVNSIRVWINGQTTTEGWEYSEEDNAVVFEYEEAPQPGDTVEIGYSTWGCTEE